MFSPRLATLSNLTEGSDLSIAHSNIGGILKKKQKNKKLIWWWIKERRKKIRKKAFHKITMTSYAKQENGARVDRKWAHGNSSPLYQWITVSTYTGQRSVMSKTGFSCGLTHTNTWKHTHIIGRYSSFSFHDASPGRVNGLCDGVQGGEAPINTKICKREPLLGTSSTRK